MNLMNKEDDKIYLSIKDILLNVRQKAYSAVNFAMVEAYWSVGKMIVEAQGGNERSEYGDYLIKYLSEKLTGEFGKGFTVTNLKYMRKFYLVFSIGHTLRDQLSWSHYRLLMRVEREEVRDFYINECIENNWSTRQLERQINSFYYERILSTQKQFRDEVKNEITTLVEGFKPDDIIKDPYVLEFLSLKDNSRFTERELETGLIDNLQEFLLESFQKLGVILYLRRRTMLQFLLANL